MRSILLGGTMACSQVAVSVLGGFVGEAMVLTFTFWKNHGRLPPESSTWNHAVWVEGGALFLAATPGLLVLLLHHMARRELSLRDTLAQFSFAVLFMVTSALSYMTFKTDALSIAGGAVVALSIAVAVVLTRRTTAQIEAQETRS